ncbi:unnamed protein product [Rhizophagus irregularis]|nr:unnamed protein product [Rhizophagus irregularis]
MDNEKPYKIIKRCEGCSLNDRRVDKETHSYYFNKDRLLLTCINRVPKYRNDSDTRIVKDIIENRNYSLPQQTVEYSFVVNEAIQQYTTLLQHMRLNFAPSDMINIYTDGSLTNHFNNSFNTFTKLMGTDWPSSTCAKLGAILLAILVLQTGQKANIITDSQAAIDSINYTRTNLTNGKNKTQT